MQHPHKNLILQWVDNCELQVEYREKLTSEWTWTQTPSWCHDLEYRFKPRFRIDHDGIKHEYPAPITSAEKNTVLFIPTGIKPELYTEVINDGSRLAETLLSLDVCYTNKEDAIAAAKAFHDSYSANRDYKNVTRFG